MLWSARLQAVVFKYFVCLFSLHTHQFTLYNCTTHISHTSDNVLSIVLYTHSNIARNTIYICCSISAIYPVQYLHVLALFILSDWHIATPVFIHSLATLHVLYTEPTTYIFNESIQWCMYVPSHSMGLLCMTNSLSFLR